MKIATMVTPAKAGAVGILRFIRKNWYMIFVIIAILPSFIASIQTSIDTNNPFHIPLEVGITIANADSQIYEDVKILEENPEEMIGMAKPSNGIIDKAKYYWNVAKLIWKFLGNLFLITAPFVFIYRIIKGRNISEPYRNIKKALGYGIVWVLLINMALVIYNFVDGQNMAYEFPEEATTIKKVGIVLMLNLPLHGVYALIKYLIAVGI